MIILGIILLIIGFVAKIAILWTIGIIILVIGLILVLLGAIGHAVGAGTSIFCGVFIAIPLNSDDINHQEDNHPDRIHEMPIHRQNLQAFGVLAP